MNSTPKVDLVSILMSGISVPTEVPVADMKTCMMMMGMHLSRHLESLMGAKHLMTMLRSLCDTTHWRTHNESRCSV